MSSDQAERTPFLGSCTNAERTTNACLSPVYYQNIAITSYPQLIRTRVICVTKCVAVHFDHLHFLPIRLLSVYLLHVSVQVWGDWPTKNAVFYIWNGRSKITLVIGNSTGPGEGGQQPIGKGITFCEGMGKGKRSGIWGYVRRRREITLYFHDTQPGKLARISTNFPIRTLRPIAYKLNKS